MTFFERRAAWERDEILRELKRCGGCKVKTAQALGIHRSYLYEKLEELGIRDGIVRVRGSSGNRGSWALQGL